MHLTPLEETVVDGDGDTAIGDPAAAERPRPAEITCFDVPASEPISRVNPNRPDGRYVYTKEELLEISKNPACMDQPEDLPPMFSRTEPNNIGECRDSEKGRGRVGSRSAIPPTGMSPGAARKTRDSNGQKWIKGKDFGGDSHADDFLFSPQKKAFPSSQLGTRKALKDQPLPDDKASTPKYSKRNQDSFQEGAGRLGFREVGTSSNNPHFNMRDRNDRNDRNNDRNNDRYYSGGGGGGGDSRRSNLPSWFTEDGGKAYKSSDNGSVERFLQRDREEWMQQNYARPSEHEQYEPPVRLERQNGKAIPGFDSLFNNQTSDTRADEEGEDGDNSRGFGKWFSSQGEDPVENTAPVPSMLARLFGSVEASQPQPPIPEMKGNWFEMGEDGLPIRMASPNPPSTAPASNAPA
eukprot:CAMPEP_0177679196 /NCGR_PEP_ID=MMETSP0447-20121125/29467_1 /TAXON_ID=0 /ORGANISM="Stygamoeba regulata, Strain BSH-02190019" /LENGTH=407 /DNA_ID=CAMNT_0019188357 /DNA_START=134 /DNA_END=1353 /DNA_ORIENTATION=-